MSFVQINSKTQVVGILGWPLSHTVSPQMHNAAFHALDLPFAYLPFAVSPEELNNAVKSFRALGLRGANVTIPHKESLFEVLDHVSELSRKSGSINTLYWEGEQLCGTTTDGLGALQHLLAEGVELHDKHIVILGYGGSAKSIAHALLASFKVAKLTICGRDESKAKVLLQSLESYGQKVEFCGLSDWSNLQSTAEIIVHTTPLGMSPNISASFLHESQLESHHIIYDIVYNPRESQLLKFAQSRGARAISGLGMLVYQGALSQEMWTGHKAPIQIMFEAAERALV